MIGPPLPIAAANNWQIKQRQKTQACKPQSYHSQNYWRTFDVFVVVWQWASHSLTLRCFMSLAPSSWWNAGLSLNLARCGEHLHCANAAGTQLDSTMTQSYSFPSSSVQVKQSFLMFSSVNDTYQGSLAITFCHMKTWPKSTEKWIQNTADSTCQRTENPMKEQFSTELPNASAILK